MATTNIKDQTIIDDAKEAFKARMYFNDEEKKIAYGKYEQPNAVALNELKRLSIVNEHYGFARQATLAHERQRNDGDLAKEALHERDKLGYTVVKVIGKLDEIMEQYEEVELHDFAHVAISAELWNELQEALEEMPTRAELFTSPQQAIPAVFVNVSHMKESNGNQWWTVNLSRNADDNPLDGIGVYTDTIEGRALYEAARLRHFFGQCDNPCILDFDTDAPKSAAPTAPIDNVREALEAVEKLRANANLFSDDYIVYNEAIGDAIKAIRALIPSTQAPNTRGVK